MVAFTPFSWISLGGRAGGTQSPPTTASVSESPESHPLLGLPGCAGPEDGGSEREDVHSSRRSSLWSLPSVTERGVRRLRRTRLRASRGAGGGGGREWEPPPPPPELTARTEMQVGPELESPSSSPSSFSATRPRRLRGALSGRRRGWPEAGGALGPGEGSKQGWSPGDCGPGQWAGKECQGTRVGSEWTAPGPEGLSRERSLHPPPPALREISELSQEAGALGKWV